VRREDRSPEQVDVAQPIKAQELGREVDARVRTFLIADVRGYTRYTQEQGDQQAGILAATFAGLAREAVAAQGGELIELRGDEALSVFESARHAVRAAVELQRRFRERDAEDRPVFPLAVGVGLDAGEAVPIEGGYRGAALNRASRLCSIAQPGQILASDTVASLAGHVEGIRFVERRRVRLKGIEKPVRVVELVSEPALPPLPDLPARRSRSVTRRRAALVATVGLALLVAMVALVVVRSRRTEFLPRLDANTIGVIDAGAAGIEAQVPLPNRPSAVATGGGYIWVASEEDGTVSRIDPRTYAAQTLSIGGSAAGVAYGGGSVWVADTDERTVVQIDSDGLKPVQRIPVGNGPGPIAAGEQAVWVANTVDGTVSRIDLSRGRPPKTISVGERPAGIAVGAGAVWVSSEAGGTLVRLDPRSGTIVGSVRVGNGPAGVAVGEGAVWVANREDGTVSRIDPQTNSVTDLVPVGRNPTAVAAGEGAAWVASEGDGTIERVDAEAGRVDRTLSIGSSPNALALSAGRVWTSTLPSLSSHRGGVLRVESGISGCRCIDPHYIASAPSLTELDVSLLAYDGLVAYRRVGGIAGGALVGNLAVRVPTPTDEGRTYTFQLRRGIRYSNGAPLRASDFRYSLERALTVNHDYFSTFYSGIVGAPNCSHVDPPARCDLSEGIGVDDPTGTVTIHLAEPDPDFPAKLTLPLASVVSAGTPLGATRDRPVPGTGPYRVASADLSAGGVVRLVRNPSFHVWSRVARPDGYPDEIRLQLSKYRKVSSAAVEESLAAVEKGEADWVSLAGVPTGRLKGLLTKYAGRLHTDPVAATFWMFLNTRVPPFDDLRVRQALSFAIDRDRVAAANGGPPFVIPTCQIVPPGFPAYRPYCPYTRAPNPAGTWTHPDLTRARALIAESGTEGMRVEVVTFAVTPDTRYFVRLLRELGYRTSLRAIPGFPNYLAHVSDSRNRAQIGPIGWVADILAPSDFLQTNFSCASFRPQSPENTNQPEFCDRDLDAEMRRAAAAQTVDAVRANDLWADVDRDLVDRAVIIPTGNGRNPVFVSDRVGNHQSHLFWGTLLDQLWVK
jgi:YVTN family beta-propeller protein